MFGFLEPESSEIFKDKIVVVTVLIRATTTKKQTSKERI